MRSLSRSTVSVAAIALALMLAGCASPWEGTELDEWGWYACQDFAEGLGKAGGSDLAYQLRPAQRAEFVAGLAQASGLSTTPEIKDAAVVLGRTVDGSQSSWQLGLDTFATRCLDRGFKAA